MGQVAEIHKNVSLISRVALYLRKLGVDFEWSVAGDGSYRPELERVLCSTGLISSFRFVGSVSLEAVPDFLGTKHILVMTSINEGTPLALLEAMSAGVVPIVSDIPHATRHVVQHGENGYLFNVTDPRACAEWIQKLDRDRDLLEHLSKSAMQRAQQKDFSIGGTLNRYYQLFDQAKACSNGLKGQVRSKPVVAQDLQPFCDELESRIGVLRNRGMRYLRSIFKKV